MTSRAETPSGRRPIVGVGIAVLQNGLILLVRRAKAPRAGEWSLPGGRQEWGETVEAAARRELFEETRLRTGTLHLLDVVDAILPDRDRAVAHHFTLIDFWTEITTEAAREALAGDDAAQLHWASPDEIDRLVAWPETRRVCRLAFARRGAMER